MNTSAVLHWSLEIALNEKLVALVTKYVSPIAANPFVWEVSNSWNIQNIGIFLLTRYVSQPMSILRCSLLFQRCFKIIIFQWLHAMLKSLVENHQLLHQYVFCLMLSYKLHLLYCTTLLCSQTHHLPLMWLYVVFLMKFITCLSVKGLQPYVKTIHLPGFSVTSDSQYA